MLFRIKTTPNQKVSKKKYNKFLLFPIDVFFKVVSLSNPFKRVCVCVCEHMHVCMYHNLMFSMPLGSSILICHDLNRECQGHTMKNSRMKHWH